MNRLLKIIFTILAIPIVFFYGKIRGKEDQKNRENLQLLDDDWNAKKRQDDYDAVPISSKRQWLRDYNKKKVSNLAKTSAKK